MKKVKVLIIHNIISPHVTPVFKELAKKVELQVWFCAKNESNRSWTTKPKGYSYKVLKSKSWEFRGQDLFSFFYNPDLLIKLKKIKPDLVIISGWDLPTYWLTAIYCTYRKIPFLLWSGSTIYEKSWRRTLGWPITKLIINFASGYLAYGLRARDYLINLGAEPEKITIAYNSVALKPYLKPKKANLKLAASLKQEFKLTGKTVILFYGQLIARKRPDLLLQAFKELQQNNKQLALIMIGSGQLKNSLVEYLEKNQIENVYLLDDPSDEVMPAYYQLADLLVLPSNEEVWGLVINQAMASGLPVLTAHQVGCVPDLIVSGITGETFQTDSLTDLSTQINKLTNSKQLLIKMGQAAQKHILKTSPQIAAQQIYLAIKKILKPKTENANRLEIILPTIIDDCKLSFAQSEQIPFAIKRIYYIYNSSANFPRGFHAHLTNHQMIICLQGSFRLKLDDGTNRQDIWLTQPNQAVEIKPLVWHEMHELSTDAILLVIASHQYDPNDYLRSYEEFLKAVNYEH